MDHGGEPLVDRSPIDTGLVLGTVRHGRPRPTSTAPWPPRGPRSATGPAAPGRSGSPCSGGRPRIIRERKYELAALMSLEVGKSRLEAMGDAEESADLIDYYCAPGGGGRRLRPADGRGSRPVERNTDVLRPYGVFACIAPFNFPLALSAGMSSAALVAGNAVVYKPAEDTPLDRAPAVRGLPGRGAARRACSTCWSGDREEIGDPLWQHPGVDGVVFTGSKAVGMRIHAGLSGGWIKPCLLELGGKNAAIVMPSADLDAAAEGVMRSAFSLQNQKCSATSRVYVHHAVAAPFLERLLERTRAHADGRSLRARRVLRTRSSTSGRWPATSARWPRRGRREWCCSAAPGSRAACFDRGHFVAPTVALLPLDSSLFREELFVPFLAVGEVASLDEALAEANAVEYGLTAGIFSARPCGGRALLRRDRGGRVLREQAHRRDDRRLARGAAVLRLEGLGLHREGRMRALLCRAVHAGAEPDGHR